MTVTLTGSALTLEEVVAVARERRPVVLAHDALERMRDARAVAERVLAEGEAYGLTTGVGVRKRVRVAAEGHDRLLVRQHRIGLGPPAPPDVVRATALRLANALAQGTTAARPELAGLVVDALNADRLPPLRTFGSVGQADLAQLADLADGLLGDAPLAPGEAIALLNQNAFSTGWGALALWDALVLLDTFDVAAALDLEAFAANLSPLDPAVPALRPYPGLETTVARLQALLAGGALARGEGARSLQDPLVFRTVAHVHGAARDALGFVRGQVEVELNAAQSNPLVLADEGRVLSVGNFEAAALATALDLARLALAPVLTGAAERAVKLLQAPLTGLPEGLGERPGLAESALSELGIAVQSFAAEARLLAQPVSLEVVSTTQAEGIEDRMTMAPLAARRLAELTAHGARVAAVELLLAAQAVDLRGTVLGAGTRRARDLVRGAAPFLAGGDPLPDLEPLAALVGTGAVARAI